MSLRSLIQSSINVNNIYRHKGESQRGIKQLWRWFWTRCASDEYLASTSCVVKWPFKLKWLKMVDSGEELTQWLTKMITRIAAKTKCISHTWKHAISNVPESQESVPVTYFQPPRGAQSPKLALITAESPCRRSRTADISLGALTGTGWTISVTAAQLLIQHGDYW